MNEEDNNNNHFIPLAEFNKNQEIPPETPGFVDNFFRDEDIKSADYFSKEEIDKIKQTAFDEGYNKCKNEIDQFNRRQQEVLQQLINNLQSKFDIIIAEISKIDQKNIEAMCNIATKIAYKISDQFISENAINILKTTIHKSLKILHKEPNLKIKVNPKLVEQIKPIIEGLKINTSFEGNIEILTDNNIHEINCQIHWDNGMIETNKEMIYETINKFIHSDDLELKKDNDKHSKITENSTIKDDEKSSYENVTER